jgi:hypothetical protein
VPLPKQNQRSAAIRLEMALKNCKKVGLQGGVYDGSFCLWPEGYKPDPRDGDSFKFFENLEEIGEIIRSSTMTLDGGAGV